jgi:hypothetical protein
MSTKKVFLPPGFTKEQRKRHFDRAKKKHEGNGWSIKEYFDGGMAKSSYIIIGEGFLTTEETSQKEFDRNINSNVQKKKFPLWQTLLILFAGLFVIAAFLDPEGGKAPGGPDISKAKPYQVISTYDFSHSARKRLEWGITSSATTFEERAQTAMQAAIDLQNKTKADVVHISLEEDLAISNNGYQLAIAVYSPDGRGYGGESGKIWQVEASDATLTEREVQVVSAWEENKERFRGKDGVLDEVNLKKFVAEKLQTDIDRVRLPWVSRNSYLTH